MSTVNSRSTSPSPSPSSKPHQDPSEITSLLPPSSSSRPHTPHSAAHPHGHTRKASVGGRSVAGSVRGYGTVRTTAAGPGPVEQAPRVSKKGQRRVLTTFPLQLAFFTLVVLTFLSLVLTLILFLNTVIDLSSVSLPYRGSGFKEFWIAAVGSWIGIGGVFFFSHPSYLFFLTTLLTLLLLPPLLLLTVLSKHLSSAHLPLLLVPMALTFLTLFLTILSNFLVRRARTKESQRVVRMLSDTRGNVGEEAVARALVGLEGKGVWSGIVGFVSGVVGLIAGLAGLIIVTLLLIDMSISAYDGSEGLPSEASELVRVHPSSVPWPIKIHMACQDPPASILSRAQSPLLDSQKSKNKTLPTIIYEPGSGIPGSLALLSTPLAPVSSINATNPGNWIFELQEQGIVGRVCVWDRPGYGFSDNLPGGDLGVVSDVLWEGLKNLGEVKRADAGGGFILVGEGFGGLITRIFAAKHSSHVHSLLHLDPQTASTYFNESPNGRSPPYLLLHRITTRLLPYLLTPLSLRRFPSVILRRSSSLSRILASSYPSPSTTYLNDKLLKARLDETFEAHSHVTKSFVALLNSAKGYPKNVKSIVLSSKERMKDVDGWEEGQRGLVDEVIGEDGLLRWEKVKGVGHFVCEGSDVCEKAIKDLL